MDTLSPCLSRAVKRADDIENPRANRTAINRAFRKVDESHLWPINGRFDATERAIRQARQYMRDAGTDMSGLEYALFLDSALSRIVNGSI